MTIAHVVLRYDGVTYEYDQSFDDLDKGEPYPWESVVFMYTDGDYGCDCNRALFIARHCDEEFPDFACGDTIELVSLTPVSVAPLIGPVLPREPLFPGAVLIGD